MITATEVLVKTKETLTNGGFDQLLAYVESEISGVASNGGLEYELYLYQEIIRETCGKNGRGRYPSEIEVLSLKSLLEKSGFSIAVHNYNRFRWTVSWQFLPGDVVFSGIKQCSYCKAAVISDKLRDVLLCPVCGANL